MMKMIECSDKKVLFYAGEVVLASTVQFYQEVIVSVQCTALAANGHTVCHIQKSINGFSHVGGAIS